MAEFKLGERVQGIGISTGAAYEGRIVIDKNLSRDRGTDVGANPGYFATIELVKKVESMAYVNNLIGPKPEPVQEPKFVAPFRSDGRNVLDANRTVVLRIRDGGYTTGSFQRELPMAEAYELAQVVAEVLTAKFAKTTTVEDSPRPF